MILLALGGGVDTAEDTTVEESDEERLADLCSSLAGVGRCRVFIAYEERPISYGSRTEKTIIGVAVVCDGGGSDTVKSKITSLIDGLYGIGTNRIKVYEMQK